MLSVVCISDTHTLHRQMTHTIPDADVLVVSGDFCSNGKESQAKSFATWLRSLPHRHKVIIAGNHDFCMERDLSFGKRLFNRENEHYLFDSEVTINGFRFYGSPWQPEFFDWAFNLPRHGDELRAVWSRIPTGLDVLVTHGPPHGILDRALEGDHAGDQQLLKRVKEMGQDAPRLHVFGHIHEGSGVEVDNETGTVYANASICDRAYKPINPPRSFLLSHDPEMRVKIY